MNEQWSQLGPHRYRRIGPIFEWAPQGTVELAHARAFVAQLEEHQSAYGELALLTDGSKLLPLAPEVRSYYVHASQHSLRGILIVIYGASLLTRATQLLVHRAAKMLYKIPSELHHTSTKEEALALLHTKIAERRQSREAAY